MDSKKGFTLIELLVVISIITLLSSIVFASLNSARSKARNANRVAQVRQLVTAFNLGLNTSSLPSSGGAFVCISSSCYGSWSGYAANATVDAYLAPYISKPADPSDSTRGYGGYLYVDNQVPGPGPYDGSSFPAGAYLNFLQEPPVSSTSCGPGRIWSVTAQYVQCFVLLQ